MIGRTKVRPSIGIDAVAERLHDAGWNDDGNQQYEPGILTEPDGQHVGGKPSEHGTEARACTLTKA